jgi:hypothetical protein
MKLIIFVICLFGVLAYTIKQKNDEEDNDDNGYSTSI